MSDKRKREAFQSTRPSRGATVAAALVEHGDHISIHAPLAGRDTRLRQFAARVRHFNPRAPRGARPQALQAEEEPCVISIHAPLVGRDPRALFFSFTSRYFNPRAPRGARPRAAAPCSSPANFNPRAPRGARRQKSLLHLAQNRFQSTRPSWGATLRQTRHHPRETYFNPRAPRGARPTWRRTKCAPPYFNPRAPRGARQFFMAWFRKERAFQSTRPSWGATVAHTGIALAIPISIHAPLVGRDWRTPLSKQSKGYFNPRAPRGARRIHLQKPLHLA